MDTKHSTEKRDCYCFGLFQLVRVPPAHVVVVYYIYTLNRTRRPIYIFTLCRFYALNCKLTIIRRNAGEMKKCLRAQCKKIYIKVRVYVAQRALHTPHAAMHGFKLYRVQLLFEGKKKTEELKKYNLHAFELHQSYTLMT